MRRVLVTGAGGFIGRRTVSFLRRMGCEVIAAGRSPVAQASRYVPLDLFDDGATRRVLHEVKPDLVLHLAWNVDHGSFWTSPANELWRKASHTLALAARDAGAMRFVGVGTCAEYDWRDGGPGLRRESAPLHPNTPYGEAKRATCADIATLLAPTPASFAWARLFHLFGVDEPPAKLVRGMIEAAKQGRALPLKAPGVWRDFLNVDTAGEALARLALSGLTGAVNIGTGQAMQLSEIGHRVAVAFDKPALYAGMDTTQTGGEPLRMVADVTRLRTLMNPTSGVLTAEWVRKHFHR